MQLGYQWEQFEIFVIGKNVLDKRYISGAAFGRTPESQKLYLGDDRQISVGLRGSF